MANENQDERIAKRVGNDPVRGNRLTLDRSNTENRENTDAVRKAERRAMLRDVQTLLPNIPDIDGYHTVWLTTTNSKDPLEARFRQGYTLIKRAELPDFCLDSQKMGEATSDRIMVNEMVAAKIPYDLWHDDMIELHHTIPLEQMTNLKNSVRIGQDGKGRSVGYSGGEFQSGVSDGFNTLTQAKPPTLAGIR